MIFEGDAKIHKTNDVFYNPAQKLNRDLTIDVINQFMAEKDNLHIFEAMSATGLRGIRFARELDKKCIIHMNDSNELAIKTISKNCTLNGFTEIEKNVFQYSNKSIILTNDDCNTHLYKNKNYYDVIDIDPFGGCSIFVDSALVNIKNGGLLCLTATDTAVLCTNRTKCFLKYDTIIEKTDAFKELALRVLIGYVLRQASKYEKRVIPILSLSIDFYVRIFFIVHKKDSKQNINDLSFYNICICGNNEKIDIYAKIRFGVNSNIKCDFCGSNYKFIGPLYNKSLHDSNFLSKLSQRCSEKRLSGIINVAKMELDTFLYYSIYSMSSLKKTQCVPLKSMLSALLYYNYKISLTHCSLNSFKTNAPVKKIYEIIEMYISKDRKIKYHEVFAIKKEIEIFFNDRNYRGLLNSKLGPLSRKNNNNKG
ncbi:N2,N2-dimethylguanosine tRNA methyltransferase [Edhazardia aedis USNM 41457]|uniref:tRNA (guanine(26)-N(2))-dimethyltransferase n=1 Tax=Edhazardia aedis (strain USNM 41457) TaxID=1003232 RepID=J9DVB1_EDHAE|nr:N2,N2-dimethylguanosine tRNA methyltransferase [Edhazardia aedis USNM 41457]|eukprot:EJW05227.1 N2,N2-dimethylguanosine tRNA methyltransferase [Edhazardia aedis USNM 41457]